MPSTLHNTPQVRALFYVWLNAQNLVGAASVLTELDLAEDHRAWVPGRKVRALPPALPATSLGPHLFLSQPHPHPATVLLY